MALALAPAAAVNSATPPHAVARWRDRTPSASLTSPAPPAAEDYALVYESRRHRLILFGGKDDRDSVRGELWELDLARNSWRRIPAAGPGPPPSEDHVLIYDPLGDRLVLHGGESGLTSNQLWSFDLKTRAWRSLGDSTTPAREEHTAIYDSRGRRMVIYGGRVDDWVDLREVRALDLDPRSPRFERWRNLTVEEGRPPGRSEHVALYDSLKNRMVVFGGHTKQHEDYLGDTWAYRFPALPVTVGRWEELARARKSFHPPPRRLAAAAYDPSRNWMVICGGFGAEGYLNDVWALDLERDVWINITPGPQPRIDHKAAYDPRAGRLILYGGDARLGPKFHDLWELEIGPGLPPEEMLKQSQAKRGR